jgi:hypothetical protein
MAQLIKSVPACLYKLWLLFLNFFFLVKYIHADSDAVSGIVIKNTENGQEQINF